MNPNDKIKQLRGEVIAKLSAQSAESRASISQRVLARFLAAVDTIEWKNSHVVLFRPMPEELNLEPLAEFFLSKGATTYYPVVKATQQGKMDWVSVDKKTRWVKGSFGIMEPQNGRPANIFGVQWIFMPGVVFGTKGERVGRGVGFYDRAVVRVPSAIRVSLAFDFQCCDNVPQNSWDQAVDWVLTESRDLRLPTLVEKLSARRLKLV